MAARAVIEGVTADGPLSGTSQRTRPSNMTATRDRSRSRAFSSGGASASAGPAPAGNLAPRSLHFSSTMGSVPHDSSEAPTPTPSAPTGRSSHSEGKGSSGGPQIVVRDEKYRLIKLRERYDREELPHVPYLDRLALPQVESYLGDHTVQTGIDVELEPEEVTLYLQLPYFEHPVVFNENAYADDIRAGNTTDALATQVAVDEDADVGDDVDGARMSGRHWDEAGSDKASHSWERRLTVVIDPEVGVDNPVETKYHKLARGLLRGLVDRDLRPNAAERELINKILASPDLTVTPQQGDLLWKFRYSLTAEKRALTKFLACVDWLDETEARQATELLGEWAPIDNDDALILLSPQFQNQAVRTYAVTMLRRASDEELETYLLQLVQALRFEPVLTGRLRAASAAVAAAGETSGGAGGAPGPGSAGAGGPAVADADASDDVRRSPLVQFLLRRATESLSIASYLNWYLRVEISLPDDPVSDVFHQVHAELLNVLAEHRTSSGEPMVTMLEHQATLVTLIESAMMKSAAAGKFDAKVRKLNSMLSIGGEYESVVRMDEDVVLPLEPSLKVYGIVPGKCSIFKSKTYPIVLQFKVRPDAPPGEGDRLSSIEERAPVGVAHRDDGADRVDGGEEGGGDEPPARIYKVIFKKGDDMRQDQLIMQLIRLMDHQFKQVKLDLCLTMYRVLSTSIEAGAMEMVPNCLPVSKVLAMYSGDILKYFQKAHPGPDPDFHVQPRVMDTYVKSCAGYCVVTYLLGIGDRHLDNLMLQPDGHMFHLDFGYILGADPKPYPPPMKLTKEMVEAMGGPGSPYFRKHKKTSEHYSKFQKLCCQAYNIMRKSASLVLNRLSLMREARLESLSVDADTTLAKLQERFRLDLTDEEAEHSFLQLVDESVKALFPVIMEQFHKLAVAMR